METAHVSNMREAKLQCKQERAAIARRKAQSPTTAADVKAIKKEESLINANYQILTCGLKQQRAKDLEDLLALAI